VLKETKKRVGRIKIQTVLDGAIIKTITVKNLLTYTSAMIAAKQSINDSRYRISHIYAEHADPVVSGYIEGDINGLEAQKTDDVSTMRVSPRDTSGGEEDIISHAFGTSDATKYVDNMVSFSAVFANSDLNGRIIVGLGLVALVGASEYLYSHSYIPGIIKRPQDSLLATWTIQFE
jgi:hypothetical protein